MNGKYIGCVYGPDGCWPVHQAESGTVTVDENDIYASLSDLQDALDPGYAFYPGGDLALKLPIGL